MGAALCVSAGNFAVCMGCTLSGPPQAHAFSPRRRFRRKQARQLPLAAPTPPVKKGF